MAAPSPRPGILDIASYVPGKPGEETGGRVIRLASNESALGPSSRALAAFRAAGEGLNRYPDGGARALRGALAHRHGLEPERIVCGSGSDELIGLLARAYAGPGDEVLYSRYGFLMYPIAARTAGASPVAAPEPNLVVDVAAMLAHCSPRTSLVFIANPNNPTGSYLPAARLRQLREGLPEHVLLVIDAAYAEFVPADDYTDGFDLVDAYGNVVVTRTFSKIYALAALRLGWAYCPPAVADVLNRVRGPFNVNAPALAAGVAALADEAQLRAARRHNDTWCEWLSERLAGLGLDVHPSVANFVLVRFPSGERRAEAANAYLEARGIFTRTLSAYGLDDCLRITVGLEEEMHAVVDALADFMG